MIASGELFTFIKGDPEGMPVYINLVDSFLYYKSEYKAVKNCFLFKETLPRIDWQIKSDSLKNIGKFTCMQASGTFGGRKYEAWFTLDIPIGLGPYKLGGLPGLILEAKSKDGLVSYQFVSIESLSAPEIKISKPQVGEEISWENFVQFVINQLHIVEALSTDEYQITNSDPPADWGIEKNKFTIISDYKQGLKSNKGKH